MIIARLLTAAALSFFGLSFYGLNLALAEDLRFMQPKPAKSDLTVKLSDGYVMSQTRLAQELANRFQAPILNIRVSEKYFTVADDRFDLSFTVQKDGVHEVECRLDYNSWVADGYAFHVHFCKAPQRNVESFYLRRSKITGAVKPEILSANGQRRIVSEGPAHAMGTFKFNDGRVLDLARFEIALQSHVRAYVSKMVVKQRGRFRHFGVEFSVVYQGQEISFKCLASNNVDIANKVRIFGCENPQYVIEGFDLSADDVLSLTANSVPRVLPEL